MRSEWRKQSDKHSGSRGKARDILRLISEFDNSVVRNKPSPPEKWFPISSLTNRLGSKSVGCESVLGLPRNNFDIDF